jgi:ubiquinone/menaquinone biosynthesis C-methylase UbiE
VPVILVCAVFGIIVVFAWRLGSRRRSIPCPVWLSWLVELDNPFAKTNRAAFIVGHLDIRHGMTVADIGCGPGRLTIPLARAVDPEGSVTALDIQAGMLARAREKAEAAGLTNIEYVQVGVGDGKLGHNRFDRAVLVTVLGEIPDRAAALREIHEALKPGGILSITEIIFDPHFQRHATVARLAAEAGFRETAFFGNRAAYTVQMGKALINTIQ